MTKQNVRAWFLHEVYAIGLESVIDCPIHGPVNATGAFRDKDGKMICYKCYNNEN
ncbi:hypothetical protein LCGC14_1835480 [marine sediment metagenome]|uniref:Uncharacterized protein n=1 Tax=marine sediment metagenome TaxID=412755 RepID=A0A0F9GF09_9ZZZZ